MKRWRAENVAAGRAALVLLALATLAATGVAWWALERLHEGGLEPVLGLPVAPPEVEDRLVLRPAAFAGLPGWGDDAVAEALPALRASCHRWDGVPGERPVGETGLAGTVADWRPLCERLRGLAAGDHTAVRRVVEDELRPLAATNHGDPVGLFTGYYEPSLRGSRRRHGPYRVPLHAKPPELVAVDLGKFRDSLRGQRLAGSVAGGELVPFPPRAEIEAGALAGRGLEVVWVDDPVDAFFLQIQGSGRVELDDGRVLRLGYAAQNGHPYYAIGRELVTRGALSLEEVSMQSIRAWLETHPTEAEEVMNTNASYVFFRELGSEGPYGSFGVVLTPGRSLAVDPLFLPMGVPVWLASTHPDPDPGAPDRPLRRLMVAQDTGGAIRGPVRGDVFWGHGGEATEIAGRMQQEGRLWLLLPRGVELPAGEAGSGGS